MIFGNRLHNLSLMLVIIVVMFTYFWQDQSDWSLLEHWNDKSRWQIQLGMRIHVSVDSFSIKMAIKLCQVLQLPLS